jgi:hypothetical protein
LFWWYDAIVFWLMTATYYCAVVTIVALDVEDPPLHIQLVGSNAW